VRGLAFDRDGALWVATEGGVIRWNLAEGTHTRYTTSDGLSDNYVLSIVTAPDGTVWAGTHVGFYHFDGETWSSYPLGDGLMDDHVTAVAVDAGGAVWISTANGISRFDPSTSSETSASGHGIPGWTSYPFSNSLSGSRVTAIAPAPDGTLWASMDRGIAHLDSSTGSAEADPQWTFYGSGDPIHALAVAPDSAVWVATSADIFRFDGQTRISYTVADGLPNDIITSIAAAPDGTLWCATQNDILSFDGHSWAPYPIDDILYKSHITSLTVAPDGEVWFMINYGTHSGVYRTGGGVSTGIIGDAYAIAAAADGTVWARTADGVARYDSRGGPTGAWTTYTVKDGLSSGRVNDIAVGLDGSAWVGTENGLSRYVPPK
jgi:ligand-binding sensor domain-containing protein